MLKTILKYAFVITLILSIIKLFVLMPFLKPENVHPALGILKFFVLIGCMCFAINHYLKHHNIEKKYTYGIGIIICLGTGILGIFFFGFANQLIDGRYNLFLNLPGSVAGVILFMVPNLLMSLLIPVAFVSKTNNHEGKHEDDILDANL